MAIDKKIYDTLETGAKNQIMSAQNNAEAERLYAGFVAEKTPTTGTMQSINQDYYKQNIKDTIQNPPTKIPTQPTTQQFVTPDLGVILPGASAPTPTPAPVPTTAPVKVEPPTTTTTTEKITTPTGETTKVTAPVTPVDKNARNQEILNNLKEGYKNDLDIQNAVNTGNWEAFKASYNMQDPEEAKVVEAYFQAKQPRDIDGIFNVLLTGQKIHNQALTSNPQFKTAKDIYDDYSTMKSFSSGQFSSALKNGELVKGTKLYNELIKDPAVAINLSNAEKLNLLNKTPVNTETVTQNQTDVILSKNPTLKQALEDGTISDTEWKTLSSSPEIDNINKEVVDLKTKYDTLKRDYDNVEIDVDKELSGKGASMSYRNALIAERRKGMYRDLLVSQDTYNNKLGYLTDLKKEKMDLLNMNMELYEKQEQRQYETEQKLEQRTYEEQQAQKELQQKFDYTYGDLKSTDPRIQKTAAIRMAEAIQKQYEGMPFRRSVDVMASDIVNQINSGMTTEQITTDITNVIQNAPTYTQWATEKKLIAKPEETKFEVIGKDPITGNDVKGFVNTTTGKVTPYTGLTGGTTGDLRGLASQYPGQAWVKNNNPAGITWNANFDNPKPGTTAYALQQAGVKFSKGTARPSAEGGNYVTFDTIDDGLMAQQIMMTQTYGNSTVNQMLQKWVGTKEGPNYAKQVAGNAGVNLNTKVSDLSQEQLASLQMAKIQKESPGLYKLLSQQGEGEGEKTFTETQKNLMSKIDIKNPTKTDETILRKSGLTLEDTYNYQASLKAGKWSEGLDETEYKRVNSLIDDVAANPVTKTFQKSQEAYLGAMNFAKGDTATDNQALIYSFAKAMDPDSVVREGEYATVQKYAQTWGEKFGMDINRILNGQEFIGPEAKNNIVKSIKSKYEASKATYDNLRKNKLKQIDDIAGKNIGDKALPSDIMDIGSIQMYPDGTFIEYDTLGNYRYYGKDKKLSEWKPVGKDTSKPNASVSSIAPYSKYFNQQ